MATIGEIMAAKGQKPLKLDNVTEATPATDSETAQLAVDNALPSLASKATPTPSMPEQTADYTPPQVPESDIDRLDRETANANAAADLREGFRRMAAGFSQGRQDINKLDLSSIEAQRNAPLAAFKARQEARKQAAEQALQAAHGRYFQAETEMLPKREAREEAAQKATETYQQGELKNRAEETQAQRDIAANREQGEMDRALLRASIERETAGKFSVATDPITGEQRIFDVHTGQFMGPAMTNATPEQKEQYKRRKLLSPQENKDLDTSEQTEADIKDAEGQLKEHPGAFGGAANLAESVVGKVPLVGPALGARAGAALRSPEEQQTRTAVVSAAAARIHELAGTRGFSKTERDYLNSLAVQPTDSAAMAQNKLKEAESFAHRHGQQIRAKLGGPSEAGRAPKAGDTRVNPDTGKRQVWVPD